MLFKAGSSRYSDVENLVTVTCTSRREVAVSPLDGSKGCLTTTAQYHSARSSGRSPAQWHMTLGFISFKTCFGGTSEQPFFPFHIE